MATYLVIVVEVIVVEVIVVGVIVFAVIVLVATVLLYLTQTVNTDKACSNRFSPLSTVTFARAMVVVYYWEGNLSRLHLVA